MTSRWTQRREQYRAILDGDTCVHPGSVFDPVSARIAEDVGFELGMFGGSVASMTVLGAPDLIVLTLTEFAEQAHRINRAAGLPVMVDADHGYGNALNVMRTVEELETAGVAGLSIEDTELPQPFGTVGTTRLLSVEEGAGKMRAAVAGRHDKSLVIAGRTDARATADFDEAIVRAKAYAAAGVDAIFMIGLRDRSQLEALNAAVDLPLIIGGAAADLMDLEYLGAHGVRVCLQGHQPFAAAVEGIYRTLKALRDGTAPSQLENIASAERMKSLTRDSDYRHWMNETLMPGENGTD